VKCGFLRLYFDRAPEAETVQDGFRHFMETHAVQCVVSPANAFGLMDGGYDSAIAVESIVIPMFGGATGGVRPHLAADMMWRAYAQLKNPPERLDWAYAAEVEIDLP